VLDFQGIKLKPRPTLNVTPPSCWGTCW